MTNQEIVAQHAEPKTTEALLSDPTVIARLSPEHLADMLKDALKNAPQETKERIGAMLYRAIARGAPHASDKTAQGVLADLRSQRRVHGIDAIRGLGFDETRAEPEIPKELIRQVENAAVKSLLILDDGRSVDDYAKASSAFSDWKMWFGDRDRNHSSGFFTETHEGLEWKVVPMGIADGPSTLGQPKSRALDNCKDHYTGHQIDLPDARLTAKAIRMHESATGEKLFQGVYTFTNLEDVVVGCADSFALRVHDETVTGIDAYGFIPVGLAPASVLRNQNSVYFLVRRFLSKHR